MSFIFKPVYQLTLFKIHSLSDIPPGDVRFKNFDLNKDSIATFLAAKPKSGEEMYKGVLTYWWLPRSNNGF